MKERLLEKATELIDQRVAAIMDAPSAPRVRRLDNYIMIEDSAKGVDTQTMSWAYLGQIQLTDSAVFVAPFVVDSYNLSRNDGIYIEPMLGEQSIFSENRPSFNRIPSGGAVYLEKSWELYVVYSGSPIVIRSKFVSCRLVHQELYEPYPRAPGVVEWPYNATTGSQVNIRVKNCTSATLVGTYTRDGQVYPGYSSSPTKVVSYTDPLASDFLPFVPSSSVAPFTREAAPIVEPPL